MSAWTAGPLAPRRLAWPVGLAALTLTILAAWTLGYGSWLLIAAAIVALLFLPGLAFYRLLAPAWDGSPVETAALAVGLSLAGYPLLLAWLTWLGGRWSPALLAGFLAACAVLAIALGRRSPAPIERTGDPATALLLLAILAVTLVLRLDHLRGVLFPAWSDSYQHVLITRLIVEGGRLPASYRPLAEIDSFRYHFGFHTLAAFWAMLTGLPAHRAVLLTGQVLNALTPLTVYFFLAYGLENRRAGVAGALITGLLTIAPASFINYGRYPQLAGQVLLPVPMALTLRSLWREESRRTPWLPAALTAAGLVLTHYRVAVFYACFVAALLPVVAWRRRRAQGLANLFREMARIAFLAILLVSPWLIHLGLALGQRIERSTALATSDESNDLTWQFVVTWGAAAPLVLAASLGAVWGLIRQAGRVVALILWVALLLLAANLRLLGLPNTFITNGAVVLALYLPVGLLGGYLTAEALQAMEGRWGRQAATLALSAIVLGGCLVGVHTLNRRILEPWRFFVTADDLQAAAWIREHIPADALFAVQAYHETGPLIVHGVDAGLWLPYLTGRRTTMPPMPYNGELSPSAADAINRRAYDTLALPADHAALARLRAQGVTHVYVVEPRIAFFPGLWQPRDFAADPAYRLLYHQGTVWIFALDGPSS